MRNGKELLIASKAFAQEIRWKSWWHLASTLLSLVTALALACAPLSWWICVPASIVGGLLFVRTFVIYHDYMHGNILKNSLLARVLMHTYGMLALSPPHIWKHSHDDHHHTNSQSTGAVLGSFPVMTTEDFAAAGFWRRMNYIVTRHPLTIAFGYLSGFFWSMSLHNLLLNPRKHYPAAIALVLHVSVAVVLAMISWQAMVLGFLLPMMIAGALGTYLFYAQHNFPGVSRRHGKDWDYVFAALHSSSYMRMGPVMRWFTGNIGFHHVHHLNAHIPFYRLPEAMRGIPELQSPRTTSLNPVEIVRCMRLHLWDDKSNTLVSYRRAGSLRKAA